MEKKKLKTLEEFNSEKITHWNNFLAEQKNLKATGIACPNCGEELYDGDSSILTSNPPKKNVICLKCDYTGYRVA